MIRRLREIASGKRVATATDRNFFTHELREYARYQKLGWKKGVPNTPEERAVLWNNTHTATVEEFQLSHDERELYTQHALDAAERYAEQEYQQSSKFTK